MANHPVGRVPLKFHEKTPGMGHVPCVKTFSMRTPLFGLFATLLLVGAACSDGASTSTAPVVETTSASAQSSASAAGTEATTVAVLETAPAPAETSSSVLADPAVGDCPVAGSEEVELVITDNDVLYAGGAVPNCLRVSADRILSFVNNAEGDATITFGSTSIVVFAGNGADSEPVSTYAAVGGTFDVTVTELDTVITVQVITAT